MEREVRIEDLQKLYQANDLVKADCGGCHGCSDCCREMGHSIVLDPLDLYLMEQNLTVTFTELLDEALELSVADGIILPNLRMSQEGEACVFLNREGRCKIHAFRPGLCRLFPLGRYYENGGFSYYLQSRECKKQQKTKVKVKKWLEVPNLKQYEEFLAAWHYFLKDVSGHLMQSADDDLKKEVNLYLLQMFYRKPYDAEMDFYVQFHNRLKEAKQVMETIAW